MATKTINQFTAITSIDSADEILAWDASAGTTRKITFANFQTGYLAATGATTGATSQAQTFTNGIVGPSWKPASDSTTAIAITDVAGTTILGVDTTNKRAAVTGRLTISGSHNDTVSLVLTPTLTNSNTSQQQLLQIQGTLSPSGASLTDAYAMFNLFSLNNSSANITTARAIFGRVSLGASYSGVVTNVRTFEISNASIGGGSVTTHTGLYINNITGGTNNYAIYTNLGLVRFGGQVSFPASTTSAASANIASGTAPTTPAAGDMWNDGALVTYQINATTNAVVNSLKLSRGSSGTPAAGFGLGILAQLESSTTEAQDAGRLTWAWSTATHASRAAIGKLTAYYTSTEREAITWTATSAAALVGIMTASPQRTLDVNGTIRVSGSDAVFTTANWAKFVEFNNGASFTWLKNGATYAHGFGGTDGGFYWFRSTADDGSAAPTYDMVLSDAGRLGLGTAGPQGLIHGHDGSGGFLFVNKTGVDGTLVTVIPNGTGDVTERLHMFGWVSNSAASFVAQVNETYLDVSTSTTKTDGSNTLTIAVAADGSFTLQATAGAATWKVLLWVFWR